MPGARSHARLVGGWLTALESPRTRDGYGRDLAAFAEWCEEHGHALLDVRADDVDDYRDHCQAAGARPATIARRLSALASFFDHAMAARAIKTNPLASVQRPAPQPRPTAGLDEREALALLDAAAVSPKVAVLVALLLLEGMKLREALELDVAHLDGSSWAMRATVTRRGSDESIDLDGRTARAITAYLAGRSQGPLLVGDSPQHGGLRLTRFGADFLLKRAAALAGLAPVSANTLRRTHIALAHREGTPVEHIARRVGHAHARDTQRYLTGTRAAGPEGPAAVSVSRL